MVEINKIDQMIAESFATVEKMREDSKRANREYEESKRRWEQEKKESDARIAKYNAEREKALKETKYYLLTIGGGVLITSVFSILGVILSLLK